MFPNPGPARSGRLAVKRSQPTAADGRVQPAKTVEGKTVTSTPDGASPRLAAKDTQPAAGACSQPPFPVVARGC
jgi:hypothetical protein